MSLQEKKAMSAISAIQPEDAVRDVMVRLREAWDRGDVEAYASLFSEDAQFVTALGTRMHGKKSIAESHREILKTFFKGTKLGGYPNSFRRISPDVILVESAGSI